MSKERNIEIAYRYHQLKSADTETLLAPNFVGHSAGGFTWKREEALEFATRFDFIDTIYVVIADEDRVALRYTRSGTVDGKFYNEIMALQQILLVDGQIAEIWDFPDQIAMEEASKS
jgi:ketosteroid isomerase-like protein